MFKLKKLLNLENLTNFLLFLIPASFIAGSLIVNLNVLFFLVAGIILIKKKGLTFQINKVKLFLTSRIPMGKLGTGEDVSNCVAFLSSDQASYVTGETIHVNGGMYMS